MRMFGTRTRRRLTVAAAATLGAGLLATTGGQAVAGVYDTPKDPNTLGEAVPGSFVTATLNVLGASHTKAGSGRPSGAARMVYSAQLLTTNAVDVVGLQELELSQARAFNRLLGTTYQLYYPGKDTRDAIAFRRDRFQLVATDTSVRIPYRLHTRTMPVVVLRDRQTGLRTAVMSVHNVSGQGTVWQNRRTVSVTRELAGIARLKAKGLPVIAVGDFNDRSQAFYCRMSGSKLASASAWWAPVVAPTTDPVTGIVTPAPCTVPRYAGIDWIWGSEGVSFLGYVKQNDSLVAQATDHPFYLARVVR